ncbi:hypothetical protein [Kribbella sp. NPDC049584]|uniref:hypothetical protein n=1 Tax=Kribbella sp. NPDC049584 TaxID=3154833 RepID=UPI00341BE526
MTATVVRPGGQQRIHASGACYSLSCSCSPKDLHQPIAHSRAYAYLREHLLVCISEVNRTKERLAQFAADSGIELAGTFVEEDPRRPAAFERLLQAVTRDEVEVVLLPSLLHLAVLGSPGSIKGYFEAATGARVITMA